MIPVASQYVRGAALHRRSSGAIGGGCAGWVKEKVARRSGIQVDWNIPVLALAFVRDAAVHARVVNLLRERLRIGDPATHGPGPAVHRSVARVHEVVEGHEVPCHAMVAGSDGFAKKSQRGAAVGAGTQIAEAVVEGTVLLPHVHNA